VRRPRSLILKAAILFTAWLVPSLHAPASAAGVTFRLSAKGQEPMDLGVNAISPEDGAAWLKNNQASVLDKEVLYYTLLTGYKPAAPGTNVNGYSITSNEVDQRMNCAGLALMRLIGGPYILYPGPAMQLLQKFGRPVLTDFENTQPWDVVVFIRGGEAQHVALVEQGGTPVTTVILSKDGPERIYRGLVKDFPNQGPLGEDLKNFGQPTYYRLDWDAIDVRRLDEEEVQVPAAATKIGWSRTPPSPRIQKTLIEAANEISSTLSLPEYGPTDSLFDPHLVWLWDASPFSHREAIVCADDAPPSSRAREILKVWIGRAPAWGDQSIQQVEIPGKPDELGVHFSTLAGASVIQASYLWTCGRHRLTAAAAIGILGSRDTKLEAQAAALAARLAEPMFQILSRRAIANGLDKPERPKTNFPYEGAP
jgi:hypothetical protein